MESPTSSGNLFELQIDSLSQNHLLQTAKWAKFLSIVGFVCCGILLLWGIFAASIINFFSGSLGTQTGFTGAGTAAGIGSAFIFMFALIGAVLYFFPCLYLFRFSVKMKLAIGNNEQSQLTHSFANLKSFYKYVGILTIIGLAVFSLELLIGIFAVSFSK